jgi:hypothetical protein
MPRTLIDLNSSPPSRPFGTARREIDPILERQELDAGLLDTVLAAIQTGARIGLHFHPERSWPCQDH